MTNKEFHYKANKIPVPRNQVRASFQKGIHRAQKNQVKRVRVLKKPVLTSLVATAFIASTFFFAPLSQALAQTPIIGKAYELFNHSIGRSLSEQHLITDLNDTAESNNIKTTIVSSYYDGNVIGLQFIVEGKLEASGEYYNANYELFNGDNELPDSRENTTLNKLNEGTYQGEILIPVFNPSEAITTVPLSFTRLGEQTGSWNFDVPVEHIDFVEHLIEQEVYDSKHNVSVKVDTITTGKASASVDYQVISPSSETLDVYMLEAETINGQIEVLSDGQTNETNDGSQKSVSRRAILTLPEDTELDQLFLLPHIEINNSQIELTKLSVSIK